MRMNDVHCVDDEQHYLHSELWRTRPELRRVPYRFAEWTDRAFDYAQPAVRAHHLALIHELAERYDFDGLELDWMRFGLHFRPGHELAGGEILTEFTAEVRSLLDGWAARRGHPIRLGARVPSRPDSARRLGMDAVTWARRGLIDWLVVTPFFATIEPDIPIELWRALLDGTGVMLCAGLEVLIRPYPSAPYFTNSLETVRGAAATLLDRGADRIYLFNYMDSVTAMEDLQNYPTLLREIGDLATLRGKPRRHILTYADTWAPGEAQAIPLPTAIAASQVQAFRIPTGPPSEVGEVTLVLGILSGDLTGTEVRVNGAVCGPASVPVNPTATPSLPLAGFRIPLPAMQRGDQVLEVKPQHDVTIGWVEIDMRP